MTYLHIGPLILPNYNHPSRSDMQSQTENALQTEWRLIDAPSRRDTKGADRINPQADHDLGIHHGGGEVCKLIKHRPHELLRSTCTFDTPT